MARVLISGASGFIGSHLATAFVAEGHTVIRLVRGLGDGVRWNPDSGRVDHDGLARARADIVVNLAGAPIAQRWTQARKKRIRDGRVRGTTGLATALASLAEKPSVFVSGSAMGYYGAQRGDDLLDEDASPGNDFLATVAREWEAATRPAEDAGIRVVRVRTGIVLGTDGGGLAKMLPPFKLGVGGQLGSGRQWMSWIAIDDMVRVLQFVASSAQLKGAINAVAPEPVRNVEFTRVLGQVLRRPTMFPVPAIALKLLFGEMAENAILASQRVVPKRLAGAGFEFRHPRLEEALRALLRR